MLSFNKLRSIMAVLLALLLLPNAGLQAKTKKGDKFFMLGEKAEARKEYDMALGLFPAGPQPDPKDPAYDLAARRARFEAGQQHVEAGLKYKAATATRTGAGRVPKGFQRRSGLRLALQDIASQT